MMLVLGIIAMIMVANLQYGWTLFVDPMNNEHHWGRTGIQFAYFLFILVETWLVPIEGYFIDRFGIKAIMAFAGIMVALGWGINSMADSLTMLYIGNIVSGLGAGIVYGCTVGNALKWFPDKRGLAAGLTAAGFGAGSALTIVPISNMITNSSYHTAFLTFAIIQGAVVFALAFVMRQPKPGEVDAIVATRIEQTSLNFTPGKMLKTPIFYAMFAAFTCVAVGGQIGTAQLAPIAKDYLIDETPVTLIFTLAALQWALVMDRILNGLARPTFGWLSDRIGRENTMFVAFGIEAIAIFLLMRNAANPLLFVLLSGFMFFAYGEIFSLFPSLSADLYGRKFATVNYGLLYTAKGAGALLVPYTSFLQQQSGSWIPVFYLAMTLNIIAALLALLVMKPLRIRHMRIFRGQTDTPTIQTAPQAGG